MGSIFQTPEQVELEKEHFLMLNDCTNRESKMNQWESGFTQSLTELIAGDEFIQLSQMQADRLEQIWEKVTA